MGRPKKGICGEWLNSTDRSAFDWTPVNSMAELLLPLGSL